MGRREGSVAALGVLGALLIAQGAAAQAPPVTAAVFPSPKVVTASAQTQISFRQATPAQLGDVVVTGSRSGRHTGTLRAHSDGRGASFVPARPFREGETVTVRTGPGARIAFGDGRSSTFRIADGVEGFATVGPSGAPTGTGKNVRLASRPDLAPPVPRVLTTTGGSSDPVLLAPKQGDGQGGPMVVDQAGRIQWFKTMPTGTRANDFRVQTYQGRPVLTWWAGRARGGSGRGVGVIADENYKTIKEVAAGNGYGADLHEFELTDHDTALLLIYEKVRRSGELVVDGIVQEVELGTGLVRFEWHGIGNVTLGESMIPAPASKDEAYDYFHPNSLDLDPNGNYIVSARNTSGVYLISPVGRLIWRLGGKRSTFTMGPGTSFHFQHDARVQPDGTIRLFDNALGKRKRSRDIVLALNGRSATLVKAVGHPDDVLAATQGNGRTLADGGTFVNFGSQGRATEFDPAGNVVWDLRLPLGYDTYRAYRQPWAGTPTTPPRLRATAENGALSVAMSWNGSTAIRGWRVLTGASADALAPAGDVPWDGLETTATVPTAAFVAVQALGGDGAVLATSRTIRAPGRG